jgi:thymidylate synthase ThyX
MCTQTIQELNIYNNYLTPPVAEEDSELKKIFMDSITRSEEGFNRLQEKFPQEAKYLVLNAHKRRVLITLNLRELYHLIKLRASASAHFTIQDIAKRMYHLVKEKHPVLVKYIRFKK